MFSIKLADSTQNNQNINKKNLSPKNLSPRNLSPKMSSKTEIKYQCGSCKELTLLNKDAEVLCSNCGSRILYKIRIGKPTEYICR